MLKVIQTTFSNDVINKQAQYILIAKRKLEIVVSKISQLDFLTPGGENGKNYFIYVIQFLTKSIYLATILLNYLCVSMLQMLFFVLARLNLMLGI